MIYRQSYRIATYHVHHTPKILSVCSSALCHPNRGKDHTIWTTYNVDHCLDAQLSELGTLEEIDVVTQAVSFDPEISDAIHDVIFVEEKQNFSSASGSIYTRKVIVAVEVATTPGAKLNSHLPDRPHAGLNIK